MSQVTLDKMMPYCVVGGSELRQIMTTGSQCLRAMTEGRPLYTSWFAVFSCGQEDVHLLLQELKRTTGAGPSQKMYLGPPQRLGWMGACTVWRAWQLVGIGAGE